jgi:hypothetical protein
VEMIQNSTKMRTRNPAIFRMFTVNHRPRRWSHS